MPFQGDAFLARFPLFGMAVAPDGRILAQITTRDAWFFQPGVVNLGLSRPALSNLLTGHADLSGEMALRIEKAFGVSMDTFMRMHGAYDIAQARKDAGKIHVRRYQPHSAHV